MTAIVSSLVSGVLFALGLIAGGMTNPQKVIGFLDFFGAWDPTLVWLIAGAVAVHFASYRLIRRLRKKPVFGGVFQIPTRRALDLRLITGAAVFGVGWGLAGYCPGPGLTSVFSGGSAFAFVASMIAGIAIYRTVERVAGDPG